MHFAVLAKKVQAFPGYFSTPGHEFVSAIVDFRSGENKVHRWVCNCTALERRNENPMPFGLMKPLGIADRQCTVGDAEFLTNCRTYERVRFEQ